MFIGKRRLKWMLGNDIMILFVFLLFSNNILYKYSLKGFMNKDKSCKFRVIFNMNELF